MFSTSGTTRPMVRVRWRRRPAARLFGRKPSASAASSTLWRLPAATPALPLNTLDAVPSETPARDATSLIVVFRCDIPSL